MKITLLHGQNHKGSTYHVARMVADKLGGSIAEFFLPRDLSEGCTGCLACLHKGRAFCPHAEQVSPIFDAMLSSDVIIISSPTYVMGMTSHLKAFFDQIYTAWLAHRPEEAMFSKIGVVVSTAAGMGMNGVTQSMAKQMFYWGVPKVYRLPLRVMASSWDEVNQKIRGQIAAKTDRVVRKIVSRKSKVKPGIRTKFMFSMMRSFQKSNVYAPLDKEYWIEKKWLGKQRPWKHG